MASIGLDNTETNRQAYRQLLLTTPGLGAYISGAIMFEETLYQSTTDGKKFVDCLREESIVPGIKVDKVNLNSSVPDFAVLQIKFCHSFYSHLMVYNFSCLFSFVRVWFLFLDQTMNLGARD